MVKPLHPFPLWVERLLAIAATVNLGLVLFDLTYVPWRNFWLQGQIPIPLAQQTLQIPIPQVDCLDHSIPSNDPPRLFRTSLITCHYDPVKGIEPNRQTQLYSLTVQTLEQEIKQQGLRSPAVAKSLESLRQQSTLMVDTDPFQLVGKSGTLERIKNRMRDRMFGRRDASSKQAFNQFWSIAYLTPANWQQELSWFDRQILPLIQTNYYRTISESGDFTNNFGWLDAPFAWLFFFDFLVRTYWLRRQYRGARWLDAMLWRWYDGLLFFPFWLLFPGWAWLRLIPVVVRLHQARLVNVDRVRSQVTSGIVASVAEEITTAVVIRILGQLQTSVGRGDPLRWLQQRSQPQVIANSVDEITAIATLLIKLTVYQVLPQVQTDLEALLGHSLDRVLSQSPAYQTLKTLPGIGDLPTQLQAALVSEVIQSVYRSLTTSMEDPIGNQLAQQLVEHFLQAFGAEVQEQHVLQEIQQLLTELLEEAKLSYLKQPTGGELTLVLNQSLSHKPPLSR